MSTGANLVSDTCVHARIQSVAGGSGWWWLFPSRGGTRRGQSGNREGERLAVVAAASVAGTARYPTLCRPDSSALVCPNRDFTSEESVFVNLARESLWHPLLDVRIISYWVQFSWRN